MTTDLFPVTHIVTSANLDMLSPESFRNIFDQIKAERVTDNDQPQLDNSNGTYLGSQTTICGYCHEPKSSHVTYYRPNGKGTYAVANYDGFKVMCSRYYDEVGTNAEVDYLISGTTHLPIPELTQELFDSEFMIERDNGYDYVSESDEQVALDRWHDKAQRNWNNANGGHGYEVTHTVTLDEYRKGHETATSTRNVTFTPDNKTGELVRSTLHNRTYSGPQDLTPEQQNAYVEGEEGFVSIKLLNEQLTRKYHAKLLNVFLNKQGRVQIGSVVLQSNADGTRSAKCVKCKGILSVPDTTDHEEQAEFVYAVIAHGNNHAAKWFKDRTFEVRGFGYDPKDRMLMFTDPKTGELSSQWIGAYKQSDLKEEIALFYAMHPSLRERTDNDPDGPAPKSVLVEHYRNCKTVGCNCTELLMQV